VNRLLFRTSNIEIVHYCQTVFGCELPSALLVTRYEKFIKKLLVKLFYFSVLLLCFLATFMVNKDEYKISSITSCFAEQFCQVGVDMDINILN